jgi:hypothetical protein
VPISAIWFFLPDQWLSTGGDFVPRRHLTISVDNLVVTIWGEREEVLLTSNAQRPGAAKYPTIHNPTTKNFLAPNNSNAELRTRAGASHACCPPFQYTLFVPSRADSSGMGLQLARPLPPPLLCASHVHSFISGNFWVTLLFLSSLV